VSLNNFCKNKIINFRLGSDEEFLRRVRFGRTESEGGDSSGSRGSVSGENKIKGITNGKKINFEIKNFFLIF